MSLDMHEGKTTKHMGHNAKTALNHYLSGVFIKDKNQLNKIKLWLGDIF